MVRMITGFDRVSESHSIFTYYERNYTMRLHRGTTVLSGVIYSMVIYIKDNDRKSG